jgi:hypothetical protein
LRHGAANAFWVARPGVCCAILLTGERSENMALSTKPPVYDKNDPQGTVKNICTYLFQLQEELGFQLEQILKTLHEMEK